ncbi:MAG: STAS domain-containing protein [Clostridiaceae bacterium]|nr:STAS domain-containing protein [Bacillota bacterium]NLI38354.1 STAS domain-containing protein [Clostridiaceae bacterium]
MDFKIAEKNGLVIASIEGQIRISTQDDFMEHLDSLCDSKGTQTVLLDMEKVSYMNSGGIGIIIDTFKKFRDKGGQLILCGLIPDINRLFEVTKLNRFIKIYSCADDALHTLKCS